MSKRWQPGPPRLREIFGIVRRDRRHRRAKTRSRNRRALRTSTMLLEQFSWMLELTRATRPKGSRVVVVRGQLSERPLFLRITGGSK